MFLSRSRYLKCVKIQLIILFFICLLPCFSEIGHCADINTGEYFFDSDPGEGNGFPLSASDGAFDSSEESVDFSGIDISFLKIGNHTLYVRFKNTDGIWGVTRPVGHDPNFVTPYNFKITGDKWITAAEIFFDIDQGEGNCISILPKDGTFDEPEEDFDIDDISISHLSSGFHTLYLRLQDNEGTWGIIRKVPFEIYEPFTISGAEYFIDDDQGPGNGIPLTAKDGVFDSLEEDVDITGIDIASYSEGTHTFNIRFKDNLDRWGALSTQHFAIGRPLVYAHLHPIQPATGDGRIPLSVLISDYSNSATCMLKVEYALAGSDNWYNIIIEQGSVSALYGGSPAINNSAAFQVGNSSGWIDASSGPNTLSFVWTSILNIGEVAKDDYRLRYTIHNGNDTHVISTESEVFSIDSLSPDIPVPTPYLPDPTGDTTPTLEWNEVSDASEYHIQVSTDALFSNIIIDQFHVSTLSFTPSSPLPTGDIYWRVSAIDSLGNESAFSLPDHFVVFSDTESPMVILSYSVHSPVSAGPLSIIAEFNEPLASIPEIAINQPGSLDVAATAMSGIGTTWMYTYTVECADGSSHVDGTATVTITNGFDHAGHENAVAQNNTFVMDTSDCGSDKIIAAEYFFDSDPGEGNGLSVHAADGIFDSSEESVDLSGIDVSSLKIGNHTLYVRFKNADGIWGVARPVGHDPNFVNPYNFQITGDRWITAAEYFFDIDPGEGSGISVLPTDGTFDEAEEDFEINDISISHLGAGIHALYLRFHDNEGTWGTIRKVPVEIYEPITITGAEYFIDDDPGPGYGIPLSAADGQFDSTEEQIDQSNIDISSLTEGENHTIYVRFRDSLGRWGSMDFSTFYIGGLDNGSWPMFRHDITHSGQSKHVEPPAVVLKWSFETGYDIFSSPAIGSDGTIYFGSKDDNIYAINPDDGSLNWSYPTGDNVDSSPAIGFDGTVYVGSDDHNLYALFPDGTLKWTYPTEGKIESSPAIGPDNTIYFGSDDNWIYAIYSDASLKWKYKTGSAVQSSPAIGPDGTLYVGTNAYDYNLYAIKPDGSLKWKYQNGNNSVDCSPAIDKDGTVYVATLGGLAALNPDDGSLKWNCPAVGDTNFSSPAIGLDGTIYIGTRANDLYAINPDDGTVKWRCPTGGDIYSSPAIGALGTVFVGSNDRYLYAINPDDGTVKWRYFTGDDVRSSPAIGHDGTVYVGSYGYNSLFALGLAENKGVLHGKITGFGTDIPIANAAIVTSGGSSTSFISGLYSILLDPGTYDVTFSKPGYQTIIIENVLVTAEEYNELNINFKGLIDTDDDGVPDDLDNCPNTPNNNQANLDGDEFGNLCDDDVDGDGITNDQDLDDDNDGMPDLWEALYTGLNPYADDANGDIDNDKLSNLMEYGHGTDPTDFDSDDDGVSDYMEVNSGRDPTSGEVVKLSIDTKDVTIALCGKNSVYFTIENLVDIHNRYDLTIDIANEQQSMDPSWFTLEKRTGFDSWEPISGDSIFMLYGIKRYFRLKFDLPCECDTPEDQYNLTINVSVKDNPEVDSVSGSSIITIDKKPHITPLGFNPNTESFFNMASNDIFIPWQTDVETFPEIKYRKIEDENFSTITGPKGTEHRLLLDDLEWNTTYIWYARSVTDCDGVAETNPVITRTGKAVAFAHNNNAFPIARDYNQKAQLTIINHDTALEHSVFLSVVNPYNDIIAGFIGAGSVDQTVTIPPGGTRVVDLAIHAQDALLTDYKLVIKVVSDFDSENVFIDYASVALQISEELFVFNLNFEQIWTDPSGFENTYRIRNDGSNPVTDLMISVNDEAKSFVTISNQMFHGQLAPGESKEFTLSSSVYIAGDVYLKVGNLPVSSESLSFELGCGPGYMAKEFDVYDPVIVSRLGDWYCINRPEIELPFTLPPGFQISDIKNAFFDANFTLYEGFDYQNHNVTISLNGNPIGSLADTIPSGAYSFPILVDYLRVSETQPTSNIITLKTEELNQGHYIVSTDFKLTLNLEKMKITRCVPEIIQIEKSPMIFITGNQCLKEGETLSLDVLAIDPNREQVCIDADTIPPDATFEAICSSGGVVLSRLSWTPEPGTAGSSYDIVFTAVDIDQMTDSETVRVSVSDSCDPHDVVLESIGNKIILVGDVLEFTVIATDSLGHSLSYLYPANDSRFTDHGDGTGTFLWTPESEDIGDHSVKFQVTDGVLLDSENITIQVITPGEDYPPILEYIGAKRVPVGDILTFTVRGVDLNNDMVCLQSPDLGDRLIGPVFEQKCEIDSVEQTFTWVPEESQLGTHYLLFEAYDPNNSLRKDFEVVPITVYKEDPVIQCPEVIGGLRTYAYMENEEGNFDPIETKVIRPGQNMIVRTFISNPQKDILTITPVLFLRTNTNTIEIAGETVSVIPGNKREVSWEYSIPDDTDDVVYEISIRLITDGGECDTSTGYRWFFNVRTPIIILPGIMGSTLVDTSVSKDEPWNREIWPNIPRMSVKELETYDNLVQRYGSFPVYEAAVIKEYGLTAGFQFGVEWNQWKESSETNDQYLLLTQMYQDGTPVNDYIKPGRVIRKLLDIYNVTLSLPGNTDSFYGLEKWLLKKGYSEEKDFYFFPYDWRLEIPSIAHELGLKVEEVLKKTGSKNVTIISHSMGGLVTKQYIINNPENHSVNKFFTFGTPSLGAPKILLPLVYGDSGSLNMDLFLDNNIIKQISRNFPSSYQLLPSARYFDNIGDYFEKDDPDDLYSFDIYDGMMNYLKDNFNTTLVDDAVTFHQNLATWNNVNSSLKTYAAVGCGLGTTYKIIDQPNTDKPYHLVKDNGDSTVPLDSALEEDGAFDKRYLIKRVEHMALPSSKGAFRLLGLVLKGDEDSLIPDNNVREYDGTAACDEFCELDEIEIEIDDLYIGIEILGSDYRVSPDGLTYYVPNNGLYTLQIKGVPDGFINLKLKLFQEGSYSKTVIFYKLPLPENGIGEMVITIDLVNALMNIDADGDGIFESQFVPIILEYPLSSDFISPVTTAVVSGASGGDGWYTSNVAVSLSATDEGGSGLLATQYRFVDDSEFFDYTGPIQTTEFGSYTLYYYSIDKNLNKEAVQTLQFIIDDAAPFIVSTIPDGDEFNVTRASDIQVVFSEDMDPESLTAERMRVVGSVSGQINGSISYDAENYILTFIPDQVFSLGETVVVTLSGDVTDTVGVPLDGNNDGYTNGSPVDDYAWSFVVTKSDGFTVRVTDVISNDCTTIQSAVIVTDALGEPVIDLTQDNFIVFENGVEQTLDSAVFMDISSSPVSVSLALDYSSSMSMSAIQDMEVAAVHFIDNMLTQDEGEIIKFADGVEVSQDFSNNTVLLTSAVNYFPNLSPSGTALYDVIDKALDDTSPRFGRRAVVVMTDGEDNVSTMTADDVITKAVSRGVPIFTIGLGTSINGSVLHKIASQTGGVYHEAPDSSGLVAIYESISHMLRNQYIIKYDTNEPAHQNIQVQIEAKRDPNSGIDLTDYTICYIDLDRDNDGDGFTENQGDCNDDDPNEYLGQTWYYDQDHDGYPDGTIDNSSCQRPVDYFTEQELVSLDTDNCAEQYNPGQEDQDGDDIGDICDDCPLDPNNDVDGDTVCGNIDNCPNADNQDQLNSDGDGRGDACDPCPLDNEDDADNDGICGNVDECPYDPENDWDSDTMCANVDPCPHDPDNDGDGDSFCGDVDNCPAVSNNDQANSDGDSFGDVCDPCPSDPHNDADNDGHCANDDNCPVNTNADQADGDNDGIGDVCDNCQDDSNANQADADGDNIGDICDICPQDQYNDADEDTHCANNDNCPVNANEDQMDTDQDGVGDVCDNCIDTANSNQADTDHDGIGNVCDPCPNDPNDDADGDGHCGDVDNCPSMENTDQADSDGDGIGDVCDPCPDDSNNDADHDGRCANNDNCPVNANVGQLDTDGDGFGDVCDNCIDTENQDQEDIDHDGIGDVCDPCPIDPNNDADEDGHCADVDNCPLIANADQADTDADTIGDLCDPCPNDPDNDADNDGQCADIDPCPDDPDDDIDQDGQCAGVDPCPNDPDDDQDGDGFCADVDNCPLNANEDQSDLDNDGFGDICDPNPMSAGMLWPDTGQVKCFDNGNEIDCPGIEDLFHGQDAQYDGPPRSYTKLGSNASILPDTATAADGWVMVQDDVTGLVWEIKQISDEVVDYDNPHDPDNAYVWTDKQNYLSAMNLSLYGGFNDWRLPSARELSTLIDSGIPLENGRRINTIYFPNNWFSRYARYWTATPDVSDSSMVWYIDFYYGNTQVIAKTTKLYVRAVRGTFQKALIKYVDNLDGTVTDVDTGLMWLDGVIGSQSWQDSLNECETGTWAGYDDWRLPDRNSLQSLIDYSLSLPAFDLSESPFVLEQGDYWTSTTNEDLTSDKAFSVNFDTGYVGCYSDKTAGKKVIAVRSGFAGGIGALFVSNLTPDRTSLLDGGFEVQIEGAGFGEIQGFGNVFFGGAGAEILSWSDEIITCKAPAHTPGIVNVHIKTDNRNITLNSAFTYFNDTDGDGLSDEIEDAGCTDKNDMDTDDDGLSDGQEDSNFNGIPDPGETNPCKADTDEDGIQDGTELGIVQPVDDPDGTGSLLGTDISVFQVDLDPSTTTDPLDSDTDDDGLPDGEEDSNSNGIFEPGETNPGVESSTHKTDLDKDGDIDSLDLSLFLTDFGRIDCFDCSADFTLDTNVNIDDLEIFSKWFGNSFSYLEWRDSDFDGILDDGNFSGTAGDSPCTGGNTDNCDDNCMNTSNFNQTDSDGDGIGDECE